MPKWRIRESKVAGQRAAAWLETGFFGILLVAEMLTNASAGVALSLDGISEHGAHLGGALIVPADANSDHVADLSAAMATHVLGGIIGGGTGGSPRPQPNTRAIAHHRETREICAR